MPSVHRPQNVLASSCGTPPPARARRANAGWWLVGGNPLGAENAQYRPRTAGSLHLPQAGVVGLHPAAVAALVNQAWAAPALHPRLWAARMGVAAPPSADPLLSWPLTPHLRSAGRLLRTRRAAMLPLHPPPSACPRPRRPVLESSRATFVG